MDKPLQSVMHSQCDARALLPLDQYQIILLGDRGTCVNNLPKVVPGKHKAGS